MAKLRAKLAPDAQQALLEQFVNLGSIDEIPDDAGAAAAGSERENNWNMARAAMYGGRFRLALVSTAAGNGSSQKADGVGFEPTRRLRACRFSRPFPR